MITQDELLAIGCEKIHWNPAYNGGYFEYYLPLSGKGLGVRDSRLSVEFDGIHGPGMMTWIRVPGCAYPAKGVETITELRVLYFLLSGREAPAHREIELVDP